MPEPWEPGYKPPSAAEAFDESQPLPRSALVALDYINRKDNALRAANARVADLERRLGNIAHSGQEFGVDWCVDVANDALKD